MKLFGFKEPKWYCRNCGYNIRSQEEPEFCPECDEETSFSIVYK